MAKEKKLSFRHFTKKMKSLRPGKSFDALYIRILYDRKTTVVRSYSEKSLTGEGEWPEDYIANDTRIIKNLWTYFKESSVDSLDVNLFNQQSNEKTTFLVDDLWNTISGKRNKKIRKIMNEKGYRRFLELMPNTISIDDILYVVSDISKSAAVDIFNQVEAETYLCSLVYNISSMPLTESESYFYPGKPPKFDWKDKSIVYLANIDLIDESITKRIASELLKHGLTIDLDEYRDML